MRPLSLLLPASLLVLVSSTGAQTLPYPQPDPSISTVEVTAPARTIRIRDDQAYRIGGTYAMSNGWYLKVRTATRHIDATIDNQQTMRLLPVAPYKFASSDDNVRMEFNRGAQGDDMLMSYIPGPRMARIEVTSVPIAQR